MRFGKNMTLGHLYYTGDKGTVKDIHKAIHYLTKAIDEDHDPRACLYLGNFCDKIDIPEWAQDYWFKGAILGDSYCMNNLAVEFLQRNDELSALFLFLLAGNQTALENARVLLGDCDVNDMVLDILDAKLETLPDESDSWEAFEVEIDEPEENDE